MSYDYEALYAETDAALGEQTEALAVLLARIVPPCAEILDVGCGQGRDALPLARAGHHVTGVDLAPSGIAAMTAVANAERLAITGVVGDITRDGLDGEFDVVLCDRTLHMLAPRARDATLHRLMGLVRAGGWIVIVDEPRNLPGFRLRLGADWVIEEVGRNTLTARRSPTEDV